MSGVATGFEKLDKITSGWQPSDLIIIAARPAMGKLHLYYLWHVIWQLIMECR
jgi:replicative DNA helicase